MTARYVASVQSADPNPAVRSSVSCLLLVSDEPLAVLNAVARRVNSDIAQVRADWSRFTREGLPGAFPLAEVSDKLRDVATLVAKCPVSDVLSCCQLTWVGVSNKGAPVTNVYMIEHLH
jgi:hypothetical protein